MFLAILKAVWKFSIVDPIIELYSNFIKFDLWLILFIYAVLWFFVYLFGFLLMFLLWSVPEEGIFHMLTYMHLHRLFLIIGFCIWFIRDVKI